MINITMFIVDKYNKGNDKNKEVFLKNLNNNNLFTLKLIKIWNFILFN